jgi:NitT/TauT family transport system substrate-binding protein
MYADFGVVTPGDYIVASDALIKKHPDVVRRFVGAVKKSITATIKHPDAAVKSFIQHHPDYNKKLAAAQLEDVLPLLKKAAHNGNHPVGCISKQQLVAGLSQLKQAGIIDTPHPAGTYYTNKFVK